MHKRRKKERQLVDNVSRSYHNQNLQPRVASAPLLSRIRNFNNLASTSIGSFFSGPTITKVVGHVQKNEEGLSGCGPTSSYANGFIGNGVDADANRDSGCFWLENYLSLPENDDLTPVGNGYYSPEAVDYCSVQQLLSSGMHDNLDSLALTVFASDPGALIKNDLLLVRASSSDAHTFPYCPDGRHFLRDLCCPDSLDENDIRDIFSQRSSFHDPAQNPLQLKSTTTLERAMKTTATATVYMPSLAACALLSRNKASFQMNLAGLDTASLDTETPSLTPDSSMIGFLSPLSLTTSFKHVSPTYAVCALNSSQSMPGELENDDNDKTLYSSPQLLEVKEGKKREQPSVQKTNHHSSMPTLGPTIAPALVSDDPEEWYGLEYTLELSSKSRQPSDAQSFSAGEHSKSRESWAAIHQGTMHPSFGDDDYYRWKNWRRLLDKQDERRKHKKGFAFKARSKELSCLFLDEMKTRDVLYWQKGVYGVVAREVKERLNYIAAHCPDPYSPPKKHDLGWYLKRSRSVACIRELKQ